MPQIYAYQTCSTKTLEMDFYLIIFLKQINLTDRNGTWEHYKYGNTHAQCNNIRLTRDRRRQYYELRYRVPIGLG